MVKAQVNNGGLTHTSRRHVCVRTQLKEFKSKVNKVTRKVIYNKPTELGATWAEFLGENGIVVNPKSHQIRWENNVSKVNEKIYKLFAISNKKHSFTVHIDEIQDQDDEDEAEEKVSAKKPISSKKVANKSKSKNMKKQAIKSRK